MEAAKRQGHPLADFIRGYLVWWVERVPTNKPLKRTFALDQDKKWQAFRQDEEEGEE